MTSRPIIVTALFEPIEFAWLDGLRRAHYPPESNRVPAHLTLFQHLPPGIADELDRRLQAECRGTFRPQARIAGVMKLDRGVAIRVESAELEEVRARIADAFALMLIPHDAASWRPHVTIQNKVGPAVAAALHAKLTQDVEPQTIHIAGLASWRYLGGPWEPIARHLFSRSGRSRRN